jgi:hypothetical protein
MRMIRASILVWLLALTCACQGTSFQNAPLASAGCDPALVGEWISLDDKGVANGELRLSISATCQIDMSGTSAKPVAAEGTTQVYTATRAGQAYAWFNAAWANRLFDVKEFQVDPRDIYLFRYEIGGNQLHLRSVDHKAVAHRIIDGDITGTVRSDDNVLVNRVTGPARPEILDFPKLFSTESANFTREKAKP